MFFKEKLELVSLYHLARMFNLKIVEQKIMCSLKNLLKKEKKNVYDFDQRVSFNIDL